MVVEERNRASRSRDRGSILSKMRRLAREMRLDLVYRKSCDGSTRHAIRNQGHISVPDWTLPTNNIDENENGGAAQHGACCPESLLRWRSKKGQRGAEKN